MGSSGFFDLQVNGYAGVDFNADDLTLESLYLAAQRLRADGVAGMLATVITADLDAMVRRLRRLVELRKQDPLLRDLIVGIHIEGPFINSAHGYVGAHPPDCVLPAETGAMQRLLDAADGLAKLFTLAPECDANFATTSRLVRQGVVVSAGHTDAPLDTLRGAIDAGLTMCTHLGNGCPVVLARHDNIIQRVLALADRLWVMFIADGAHIPFFALQNYLRIVGIERSIVVTDAISAAGMGPGRFTIGSVVADVGEDLVPRDPHDPRQFAGSALTMPRAAENLRQYLGLNAQDIARLCAANPNQALAQGAAGC